MNRTKITLSVTPGYRTALLDGCLVPDSPFHMTTEFFYKVSKGDYIECVDRRYVFAVGTFSMQREDKYLYTYDYKQDSAWLTYRKDLTPDSYSHETYVFEQDGYCRICLRRADGAEITGKDADKINGILRFYVTEKDYVPHVCFEDEIVDTVKKVTEIQRSKSLEETKGQGCERGNLLTLCLLTDSHYTVNGTWEDTADNIGKTLAIMGRNRAAEAGREAAVDGIVHLGDFTDGMTSKKVTSHYIRNMLTDLHRNHVPVYVTLGNHDFNYFRGNKQRFSMEELRGLFDLEQEYYYRDFEKQKIRCLFLISYNPDTPIRYGFTPKEVDWVKETLEGTPKGYKVLIFSHEAPLDHLDFWARIIRNGKNLMQVLEDYNAKADCQILAFIHGHTHAEHVYRGSSFPIISIGSNKCEYFPEKKPEGAHAYDRKIGTVTQDLWDILLVDGECERLHFVRFGAGEDRVVDCHKCESTWRLEREERRKKRTMKIWAHRGASGFAPENTLPAFEVAKELDVDGIELDVHLTKDGEVVVIHDEQIDRTGDGKGLVKDYTLEELKQFNFAKNKPLYGFVTIPTLREVYELFQGTDYMINVELKTGRFEYDGMEEKVHALTEEMGMTRQVIYSSFNHASILRMQQYATEERTAFLISDGWLDVAEYAQKHQVQAIHPAAHYPGLDEMIRACHAKGIKVNVWTINEEEEALRMKEMGAEAIITNHPGKMRELLTDRN